MPEYRYMSKAYKNGQKAGSKYASENFHYRMATGRNLERPINPYNGAELSADWQAGFDSKAGK